MKLPIMPASGLDPIIRLLAVLVVFFVLVLIYACHLLPNNQQVFTVLSGLVTGFGGALLGLVRGQQVPPIEPAS